MSAMSKETEADKAAWSQLAGLPGVLRPGVISALETLRGAGWAPGWQQQLASWRFRRQLERLAASASSVSFDFGEQRLAEGLQEALGDFERASYGPIGARRAGLALLTALLDASSEQLGELERQLGRTTRLQWRHRHGGGTSEQRAQAQDLWRRHERGAQRQLQRLLGDRKPALMRRLGAFVGR